MSKHKQKTGFTLVELSLSLVFIGILSLAIVLLITNTIGSYQRGLMLNQINTVGMELVADIRGAIQSAPAASGDENRVFVINGTLNGKSVPAAGVFCTGSYTYIWNSGYLLSSAGVVDSYSNSIQPLKFDDKERFRLLKVKDSKAAICGAISENGGKMPSAGIGSATTGETYTEEGDVEELLADSNGLAIYSLDASAPATYNNVSFYTVSMILGTMQSGMDINATGNYCKEENGGGVLNYCSINKFNFAAQATGGKRNG